MPAFSFAPDDVVGVAFGLLRGNCNRRRLLVRSLAASSSQGGEGPERAGGLHTAQGIAVGKHRRARLQFSPAFAARAAPGTGSTDVRTSKIRLWQDEQREKRRTSRWRVKADDASKKQSTREARLKRDLFVHPPLGGRLGRFRILGKGSRDQSPNAASSTRSEPLGTLGPGDGEMSALGAFTRALWTAVWTLPA